VQILRLGVLGLADVAGLVKRSNPATEGHARVVLAEHVDTLGAIDGPHQGDRFTDRSACRGLAKNREPVAQSSDRDGRVVVEVVRNDDASIGE
jgi:hypothetical protein